MDLAHVPLLLVLPVLMAVSALCSAAETALFSLTYSDRLRLRKRSPGAARAVGALLARPRALLVSILLVTNIANVAYLVVSSVIALGTEVVPGARPAPQGLLALAFSAVAVLALILFTDLLPKLLARRLRVEFCRAFALPMLAVFRAVGPVQRVLDALLIAPLSRLVRPRAAPPPVLTVDELSALLTAGAREGDIGADEQRLLEDVVALGAVRVRDAMTPRLEIPWLDAGATAADITAPERGGERRRIVLCRGTLDREILGWVDAKRAWSAWSASPASPPRLTPFVRPVLYVPETARLDQLLDHLRQKRTHAALCVDEHGSIVGMIEIDDVVARLIAEPTAEGESEHEDLEPAGPGRWLVPGRFGVRDLCGIFETPGGGLTIRGRPVERRVATVAGLVLLALGRLPRVGDEVRFGNLSLRVESMRGRTIERVLISVSEPAPVGTP